MRRWVCTAALLSGLIWAEPAGPATIREPIPFERRLVDDPSGRPAAWWLAALAPDPARWLAGVAPVRAT